MLHFAYHLQSNYYYKYVQSYCKFAQRTKGNHLQAPRVNKHRISVEDRHDKHPKFDANHETTQPRNSTNPKENKYKGRLHSQTDKSQKQTENPESKKEKIHIDKYRGTSIQWVAKFSPETRGQKTVGRHIPKKNHKEFYVQLNYPSKIKTKEIHSQINRDWGNLLLADMPDIKC